MAVIVLISAGGLYLAFGHYNGKIDRFDFFGGVGNDRPTASNKDVKNFLLVGSDSRDGANAKGTQLKGAGFVTGQRADTVILVHLFASTEKVQLVSFPRDSYVEIPAFTNPKSGVRREAHFSKLNSAFAEGGAPLLILTIEKLSGVRVDHFLQMDFTGFKGMVDKLGGVDVCLTAPAKERRAKIDLPAGRHHINGETALAFVRQRYGLAGGDIDRIARQQQFMGSLVNKVLSSGTLLDPFKLTGFLDIATSSVQVDEDFSGTTLKDLAVRLRGFSSGGVLFTTVPVAEPAARRNGASVVLLDDAKATAMFDALRRDEAPGAKKKKSGTPAIPITVAPENIRVAVFNGSGVQGQGRKAAEDLAKGGFQIVGIATNRGTGAEKTTILHSSSRADSARTLQAAIPGSVLQVDESRVRTLEVVVGSSYTGSVPVTVTAGGSKKPTASVPVKTAKDNACTR